MDLTSKPTKRLGSWPRAYHEARWLVSGLGSIVLCLSLINWQLAASAGLLGGIVIAVDLEARELTLQMPEGHAALFPAAGTDVLKEVKVGDRVSIELDRDGKIIKLFKLPVDPGN